jgi:hypothetical protein
MKKISFILLLVLGFIIYSCDKEEISVNNETGAETLVAISETFMAVTVDDVQFTVDQFSGFGEGYLKSGEIVETATCPVITAEKIKEGQEWPRRVTIDFGEGCTKNEKLMSGKMVIVKTGPWMQPGSVREVTFTNFVMDNVKIEGDKRIANNTEKGGKITFGIKTSMTFTTLDDDGNVEKVVNRKEDRKQVWQIDFSKMGMGMGNDMMKGIGFEISGTSRIATKKDGKEMVIEKTVDGILIQMGCRFPQAGVAKFDVKTYEGLQMKFKLDYATIGSGTSCQPDCDCVATLYMKDTSKDIDLSEKWKEQLYKK